MADNENNQSETVKPLPVLLGRPTKFEFWGVFLPSLEWEMKLNGTPVRAMEDDPTFGTLIRNQRRMDVDTTSPDQIRSLCRILELSEHPVALRLIAALNGDMQAQLDVEAIGRWQCFTQSGSRLSPFEKEYASLESHCACADKAVQSGDFAGAAALIGNSEMLLPYWRNGSLDQMAQAESAEQTYEPRLVAWLELQMSVLAKLTVSNLEAVECQKLSGSFENLLEGLPVKPFARWIRCLQNFSGAKSQSKFYSLAISSTEAEPFAGEATFKRWFSGSTVPSEKQALELMQSVVRTTVGDTDACANDRLLAERAFQAQFWVARRIDGAIRFASLINPQSVEKRLAAASVSEWAKESFNHWKSHWQEQIASGVLSAG